MMRTLKSALILGAGALLVSATSTASADDSKSRVYELRTYYTNPGKLDDLHKRFRDLTLRMFKKHGITVVGFWTPLSEKDGKNDKLVYLVSFPSPDAADASWKAFGNDPEWKKGYEESHKNGPLVKTVERVFLDPTDYSPAISTDASSASSQSRAFELRTYTASPGKFEDLHKRFREHTIDIFKKHGMTSVGYWVPQDDDKGHKDTLIYLLAFPSKEAADASWKAFREDPEWLKVRKESQPDDIPLAKDVKSLFLQPTDYSPMK